MSFALANLKLLPRAVLSDTGQRLSCSWRIAVGGGERARESCRFEGGPGSEKSVHKATKTITAKQRKMLRKLLKVVVFACSDRISHDAGGLKCNEYFSFLLRSLPRRCC